MATSRVPKDHTLIAVPSFINPNGSSNTRVVVREGLTQKLICNVSGVPAPTIKWYMSTTDGKARRIITAKDQPRMFYSFATVKIITKSQSILTTIISL